MPIFRLPPEMMIGNTPEVHNGSLGFGVQANYNTVEMLIKIARQRSTHPRIRELTLRVLQYYKVKSQDYINEALAVGLFVQKKVRYVRDIHNVETVHDPLTLIDQIKRGEAHADCDDQALLIVTMLLSIGHQPFFRIVKYKNQSGPFNHIYVVVYERNHATSRKRIVLDAIIKRKPIGYEVPHVYGEEIKA
ncbi:MAG: hypothetical protein H7836_04395 [Magnetococcus sp. YQC-3]